MKPSLNACPLPSATCHQPGSRFFMPMTVTLNGTKREFPGPLSLPALLEAVGLAGKPVVVEHNQTALLPREIPVAMVQDQDVIEIVQITAGG